MANDAEVQVAVNQALKEQKKKKKKKRLIIFGILIAIVIIAIAIGSKPKNYDFDNPVAKVTVDTILNEFNKDSAVAGEKYSDQVIAVTGQVGSIEESYARIRAYDDNNWLYNVYAYMENTEDLKKFKVGDTVTIEGVCDKTTIFGDVKVRKCIINDKFAIVPDYENPKKVSIGDFVKAYKDNQVSADEKYKGKTVEFSAEVTYIADDYAVVEPSNADSWDFDCDVQVYFENEDDLKKVSKGKKFTITGDCYGKADMYTAKVCRAIIK